MRAVHPVQLIPLAQQAVMPWANGSGSTRQVAIDPPDGSLGRGFRWRVSRARIDADGPFSLLPGVDRSLWHWSGAGLRLEVGDRAVVLDRPLQRIDFAGETPVTARLLAGPCEDLNVMVDRATIRAEIEVVRLIAAGELPPWSAAGTRLVLVLSGTVRLPDAGLVAGAGDALRHPAPSALTATAVSDCVLLDCRFELR